MPSYQDIETRLRVIEDKVQFILTTFKFDKLVPTGMLDQQGRPIARKEQATLLDIYREVQAGLMTLKAVEVEDQNGTA